MRTEKKRRDRKDERGASLVIALLALLVISMLGAGIIFVAGAETATSANYTELAQARYAAEAGVQQTINWLTYNYNAPTTFTSYNTATAPVQCSSGCAASNAPVVLSGVSGVASNYPDSTVSSAYNTALGNQAVPGLTNVTYSTYATLIAMNPGQGASWIGSGGPAQTWRITSQGTVAGLRTATVQVTATFQRTTTPIFPEAVFATGTSCPSITMSASSFTDSYDSSQGTYAQTVLPTQGNIGTNGNVTLSGSAAIKGNAYLVNVVTSGSCPTRTYTSSSSVGVTGSLIGVGSIQNWPNPTYPNPSPALTNNQNYSNNTSLSPGNYGNVSMSGGKTLTLSPGTYNMNSLVLSGGSVITVSPPGTVVLEIAGVSVSKAIDMSGGSITNTSGTPASFQIVYAGTKSVTLSGGSGSAAVVYAPNADVVMSGGSPWFGSIVCQTMTDSGGSAIHYDRSLGSGALGVSGPFQMTGFSWSKF
jgi:Tfp pilus assembly protein PilX